MDRRRQARGYRHARTQYRHARTRLHPVDELVPRVHAVHLLRVPVRAAEVLALVVQHEEPHLLGGGSGWVGGWGAVGGGAAMAACIHASNLACWQVSRFRPHLEALPVLAGLHHALLVLIQHLSSTDGCVKIGRLMTQAEIPRTHRPDTQRGPTPCTAPHAPRCPTRAPSRSRACS